MITDMLSNKKFNPLVTEFFNGDRKLSNFLVFFTESHFTEPKIIRPNTTHYFIIEISNKEELQQIAFNYSSHIYYEDFMNLYKKCLARRYSFLVIDSTLESDNPLRFRKNHLKRI